MKINAENINTAERKVGALDIKGKERLVDEIYRAQPNLLASVLALTKFGISYEKIDFAIDILLIAYQSMIESSGSWRVITENDQDRHFTRIQSRVKFTEDLNDSLAEQAIQQVIDDHPEPLLFAFAADRIRWWLGELREEEESDKYVLLCALNLVECIAHAAKSTY